MEGVRPLWGRVPQAPRGGSEGACVLTHEIDSLKWRAEQMKASLLDVLALTEAAKQLQAEEKISKEVAMLSVGARFQPRG